MNVARSLAVGLLLGAWPAIPALLFALGRRSQR